MGLGDGLRRLDDRADAFLRARGTSLLGDHPNAKPGRAFLYGALLVTVVIGVVKVVDGTSPWVAAISGVVTLAGVAGGLLVGQAWRRRRAGETAALRPEEPSRGA